MKIDKTVQRQDIKTFAAIFLLAMTLLAVLSIFGLTACAPQVSHREFEDPKTVFGPLQKEVDLGLNGERTLSINKASLNVSGKTDSASVFRTSENLIALGKLKNMHELSDLGLRIGDAFYSATGTATDVTFDQSLFTAAAVGETKADTKKTVSDIDGTLAEDNIKLTALLKQVADNFTWPSPDATVTDSFAGGENYAHAFLTAAQTSGIDQKVLSALNDAFKDDFFAVLDGIKTEAVSIFQEKSPLVILQRFDALIIKNAFNLDPASQALITKGESVFAEIDTMNDAPSALKVLVGLWELVDPADREKTFKPVSSDLYDLFNGKTDADLECLTKDGCGVIVTPIERSMVRGKLKDYGIDKLQSQIQSAARSGVIAAISKQVALAMPGLPQIISDRANKEIGDVRTQLASVQSNYSGFIHGIAVNYSKSALQSESASIVGAEASQVVAHIAPGKVSFAPSVKPSVTDSVIDTGAEVLGASMSYANAKWNLIKNPKADDKATMAKEMISQINKMLAIGGFNLSTSKAFPSLSYDLSPGSNMQHFNIRKLTSSNESFAVPDALRVSADLTPVNPVHLTVGARGQAELLRGLSSMIKLLRDYQATNFDSTLGNVNVGDYITDLPAKDVDEKLFPKDMMFALGVGNAASILQNMSKPMTSVFLLNLDRETIWADKFNFSDDGTPATMAGIVDLANGKRTQTVKSQDVARYLIAIANFMDATEGIEATKSDILLQPSADGKRPLDVLTDAKSQLRLLVLGLANFLSHQMQDSDGGVRPDYSWSSPNQSPQVRTLLDQALVAQALVRASDIIGNNIYRWAALDIFSFMNRVLWDPQAEFYRDSEAPKAGVPSLETTVTTLLAGEQLKPSMSIMGSTQWDKIASPWLTALRGF